MDMKHAGYSASDHNDTIVFSDARNPLGAYHAGKGLYKCPLLIRYIFRQIECPALHVYGRYPYIFGESPRIKIGLTHGIADGGMASAAIAAGPARPVMGGFCPYCRRGH